jgi:hypothetical protein
MSKNRISKMNRFVVNWRLCNSQKKKVTSGKISNLASKTANVSQKALIFVEEY